MKTEDSVESEESEGVHNIKSFLAGVFFGIAILFVGIYIGKNVDPLFSESFYSDLVVVLFIGASTGHYVGMALKKERTRVHPFLIGVLSLFFSIFLGIGLSDFYFGNFTDVPVLPAILLFTTLAIFLIHNAGLADSNERVEGFISFFSESVALLGLIGLYLIKYGVPLLAELNVLLEVVTS